MASADRERLVRGDQALIDPGEPAPARPAPPAIAPRQLPDLPPAPPPPDVPLRRPSSWLRRRR